MADKDTTRYLEVVDTKLLDGKGSFCEIYKDMSKVYNLNQFTSCIPENRVHEYEHSCIVFMYSDPALYEYMYWRMKLNSRIHKDWQIKLATRAKSWYKCDMEKPETNFFPHLRNAIDI